MFELLTSEKISQKYPLKEAILQIYDGELYFEENFDFIMRCVHNVDLEPYYMEMCLKVINNYNQEKIKEETNGKIIHYFESGGKKYEGVFRNKQKEGVHYLYYFDGKIREKIMYRKNERQGNSFIFLRDGTLFARQKYVDGYLSGPSVLYYQNGKIQYKGEFFEGYKMGKFEEYNIDGQCLKICYYNENRLSGPCNEYYPNGKIKNMRYYLDGLLHNTQKSFTNKGKILKKSCYYYGKLDKKQTTYYTTPTNSMLKQIISYKNGKKHGKHVKYFKNGTTEYSCHYNENEKNGSEIFYSMDGKIKRISRWKNGISHLKFFQEKNEMNFRLYKETRKNDLIVKIPKQFLFDQLTSKCVSFQKCWNRKKLLDLLLSHEKKNKSEIMEDNSIDLFGNLIVNPVIGNDGGIYEKTSMEKLFLKENDTFKNINYHYVDNILVPNYPRMYNGKKLSKFYNLQELEKDKKIEKRMEFLEKLRAFV